MSLDVAHQKLLTEIYINGVTRRNLNMNDGGDRKVNVSYLRHRRNEKLYSKALTEMEFESRRKVIEDLLEAGMLRDRDIYIVAPVIDKFGNKRGERVLKHRIALTKEGVKMAASLLAFKKI